MSNAFYEHGIFYNYADDNTISFSTPDFDRLFQVLPKTFRKVLFLLTGSV